VLLSNLGHLILPGLYIIIAILFICEYAIFLNSILEEILFIAREGNKVTTVLATEGQGPDRSHEISYTDTKVIGNGSFGVVYQAKICDTGELVAIKKVLQDKRFKAS